MFMGEVNHYLPSTSTPIYAASSTIIDMGTLGDRLRELRETEGLTLEQAGAIAGTTKQSMSQIEKGQTKLPNGIALEAWSRRYGVNLHWLATGKGPKRPDASPQTHDGEWGDILAYSQAVGLGKGAEAQEYTETHKLKFRADSLERKRLKPSSLAVMYGNGDSMEPRIKKGDAVLFDTSDTRPRDDTIFVVQWKDEYFAKRCMILDDNVYFKADNPNGDHPWKKPKAMNAKREPITIIGRVRWIGSWED